MNDQPNRRPLIAAGTAIGIGLGGFVDGIVFHQLLQLHNMLSAKFPTTGVELERLVVNLEINMFWDGLFHVFTWLMTAAGIAMLWNAVRRPDAILSGRMLFGSILLGAGLFNLVEGIIDHHILHVHHVTETENHLIWDLAFLGSGVLLMLIGWGIIRSASNEVPHRQRQAGTLG